MLLLLFRPEGATIPSSSVVLPFVQKSNTLYAPTSRIGATLPFISDTGRTLAISVSAYKSVALPYITTGSLYSPSVTTLPPTLRLPYIESGSQAFYPYKADRPLTFTGVGWQ